MNVAYIVSRFPLLSETFILREMLAVERQGDQLEVCALRRAGGRRHPRLERLRAHVWWAPWLGAASHLYWLRRRPGAYFRTLADVLIRNCGDLNLWLGAVGYWGKAVALSERVARQKVECMHAHYATHPALVAYVAHRLTGVPFSFTVHAHDIYCHRRMLARKAMAADVVVAISAWNRQLVLAEVEAAGAAAGGGQARVEVVHCGVECGALAQLACERGGRAAAPLRILSVGTLREYKGHRHLIAACGLLSGRGVEFECRILGGGTLQRSLRAQIERLGLGERVRLEGPATEPEVLAALAWADVFAMPSVCEARSGQMEGIPVALMEAMASGLPVVASRLSGIPELVADGEGGVLVEAGDEGQLADALQRMQDAELRRRLAEGGRAAVVAGFDLERSALHLRALWRSGTAGRPRAGAAA